MKVTVNAQKYYDCIKVNKFSCQHHLITLETYEFSCSELNFTEKCHNRYSVLHVQCKNVHWGLHIES